MPGPLLAEAGKVQWEQLLRIPALTTGSLCRATKVSPIAWLFLYTHGNQHHFDTDGAVDDLMLPSYIFAPCPAGPDRFHVLFCTPSELLACRYDRVEATRLPVHKQHKLW